MTKKVGEDLPFANNEVVRLMKKNLDPDKMIREQVKVDMNKFLYNTLVNVCEKLNNYPYTYIEPEMLKEAIYPYTNTERINEEKINIIAHLDNIQADCELMKKDVNKTLKTEENEEDDQL